MFTFLSGLPPTVLINLEDHFGSFVSNLNVDVVSFLA